uniref:acetylornithine transaminase n=1 Tax=Chromera velia CCMP2878 TaxID=1169474 RepID=A0A0G4FKW8_9ALVE|eukprot:Cvel_17408.t1-p1 / transcript=Cvel_17408.t1 / gene=Cvel_17408 / organism=Chromera_velia_CCMP2878 / gene_product=Acetylornithine aminotransferase,, putative / transcript_product=Acetylornithine aminotransferase,, putative / location=Cvel_scaffold1386:30305-37554(-) / protein_length=491 / sequence_SO=supercontig / SO=protein_coding / is_pseudo=false
MKVLTLVPFCGLGFIPSSAFLRTSPSLGARGNGRFVPSPFVSASASGDPVLSQSPSSRLYSSVPSDNLYQFDDLPPESLRILSHIGDGVVMNTYGKGRPVMVRGEGARLKGGEGPGEGYLDFTAGIAVNALGHCDPGLTSRIILQASTLVHHSNYFYNVPQIQLAVKLVKRSFADKVFFCNTGTEANEAAMKFARKFHFEKRKSASFLRRTFTRRQKNFVAFEKCFHGRTLGALSLTWKKNLKEPFEPLIGGSVRFGKWNDLDSAKKLIGRGTAAVIVEPVQGEGGVNVASPEFLQGLRDICDQTGTLLIFDEVQSGLGRTGKLFAHEHSGVKPDIMTLAKPLAGGLPIGAVLVSDKVADTVNPGDHGSTFAGNPLCLAAANHVFDSLNDEKLLAKVVSDGEWIRGQLRDVLEKTKTGEECEVRGQGLLIGVSLPSVESATEVKKRCAADGVLVLTAGAGNVIRLAPPLNISPEDLRVGTEVISKALMSVL